MRPDFSDIKYIPFVFEPIFKRHNLYFKRPCSRITSLNMVKQISLSIIRIYRLHLICLFRSKVVNTSICFKVVFNPKSISLSIYPLISVRPIAIHSAVSIRSSPAREKHGNLMRRLWSGGEEIPYHIRVFHISQRISLLSMNKIRELDRVPNEKHRSVVSDKIIVSFFSVEFNSKPSWVSFRIS